MYSRYNKDKACLSSKTPTCLIFKTLTFILYDLINHPNIMGARRSCGKSSIENKNLPINSCSKDTILLFTSSFKLFFWTAMLHFLFAFEYIDAVKV